MSSSYENAMSDLQANNYTQRYPVAPPMQRHCPVCGAQVVTHTEAGAVMLDYHLDARYFKTWCAGSDMNLSEAANESPADE